MNSTSKSGKSSTGQEGEVTSGRSTGQTAKDVGIGAGIGTVAGLIFGHALRGLAIGTIAGGGYVLATRGKDVDLPTETGLVFKVDQNTAVPATTGERGAELWNATLALRAGRHSCFHMRSGDSPQITANFGLLAGGPCFGELGERKCPHGHVDVTRCDIKVLAG